jgi:hypothetical protein
MSRAIVDLDYLAAQAAGFPCRDCGKTWTGGRRCHCATCHESFNSADAFDRHRRDFACRPPAECGLELAGGYWQRPNTRPAASYTQSNLFDATAAPPYGARETA